MTQQTIDAQILQRPAATQLCLSVTVEQILQAEAQKWLGSEELNRLLEVLELTREDTRETIVLGRARDADLSIWDVVRLIGQGVPGSEPLLMHFNLDLVERELWRFEERFPDDDRPRRSLEAARQFADRQITRSTLAPFQQAAEEAMQKASEREGDLDAATVAEWAFNPSGALWDNPDSNSNVAWKLLARYDNPEHTAQEPLPILASPRSHQEEDPFLPNTMHVEITPELMRTLQEGRTHLTGAVVAVELAFQVHGSKDRILDGGQLGSDLGTWNLDSDNNWHRGHQPPPRHGTAMGSAVAVGGRSLPEELYVENGVLRVETGHLTLIGWNEETRLESEAIPLDEFLEIASRFLSPDQEGTS